MRAFFGMIGVAAALSACAPEAQTNNPAIATDEAVAEREMSAPAEGASSFTQSQAEDRLIDQGYTNPTALVQTEAGGWSGQATLNGQVVNVMVDYQGNIVTN